MEILENKLTDLQKIFKANKVQFAYVFGSAASKKTVNSSDIDIAVFLNETNKTKRFDIRLKLISELEKNIDKKIDLVILNDIESLFFKYVIISEGKKIFEIDQANRVEEETKIIGEYFDFKPFLEEFHKSFIKRKIYA